MDDQTIADTVPTFKASAGHPVCVSNYIDRYVFFYGQDDGTGRTVPGVTKAGPFPFEWAYESRLVRDPSLSRNGRAHFSRFGPHTWTNGAYRFDETYQTDHWGEAVMPTNLGHPASAATETKTFLKFQNGSEEGPIPERWPFEQDLVDATTSGPSRYRTFDNDMVPVRTKVGPFVWETLEDKTVVISYSEEAAQSLA